MLIASETFSQHVGHNRQTLDICRANQITFGKKKCQIAKTRVDFVGYVLSQDGVQADPEKVRAIADFATPTNITQLRSFLGLVNQLAEFSVAISEAATPLRPLLKTHMPFIWTPDHARAFAQVKAGLVAPPVLSTFDIDAETVLETEASRTQGLEFDLLQKKATSGVLFNAGPPFYPIQKAVTRQRSLNFWPLSGRHASVICTLKVCPPLQ